MELTTASIKADLEGFNQRIAGAELKLSALPVSKYDSRKTKAARRALHAEVDHIRTLIGYATDALREVDGYDTQPAAGLERVYQVKGDE